MHDDLTIPDFLKISQEERQAAWKGLKLKKVKPTPVNRLRVEDAQTRAFRREIEKQNEAKKKAALKRLRENYSNKPKTKRSSKRRAKR